MKQQLLCRYRKRAEDPRSVTILGQDYSNKGFEKRRKTLLCRIVELNTIEGVIDKDLKLQ